MIRRSLVALLAVGILLVPVAALAVGITPVKVLDKPGSELTPFRNAAYLLYTADTKTRPAHWDVFAKPLAGGAPVRVNATGFNGWAGGFDPGSNAVIYQEWNKSTSDIRLYDLDTQSLLPVPRALHTKAWESSPHISSTYFSFLREVKTAGVWYFHLYITPRTGGPLTLVASIREHANQTVDNDFLGDHYVSWTVCTATCTVRVYNIDTQRTRPVPTVKDHPQYASTIDETNKTIFFVRSGFGCGVSVAFFVTSADHLSQPPTKLATLADGIDVANAASLDAGDLLYPQVPCRTGWSGIYSLPGADT